MLFLAKNAMEPNYIIYMKYTYRRGQEIFNHILDEKEAQGVEEYGSKCTINYFCCPF